ncbi:hypothetical protein FKP32DRAFT_1065570 [Trametes sanguinea]|nr:hypothetical protein FKP32DRAFT_1065570 [Trametes sanguinea]
MLSGTFTVLVRRTAAANHAHRYTAPSCRDEPRVFLRIVMPRLGQVADSALPSCIRALFRHWKHRSGMPLTADGDSVLQECCKARRLQESNAQLILKIGTSETR